MENLGQLNLLVGWSVHRDIRNLLSKFQFLPFPLFPTEHGSVSPPTMFQCWFCVLSAAQNHEYFEEIYLKRCNKFWIYSGRRHFLCKVLLCITKMSCTYCYYLHWFQGKITLSRPRSVGALEHVLITHHSSLITHHSWCKELLSELKTKDHNKVTLIQPGTPYFEGGGL